MSDWLAHKLSFRCAEHPAGLFVRFRERAESECSRHRGLKIWSSSHDFLRLSRRQIVGVASAVSEEGTARRTQRKGEGESLKCATPFSNSKHTQIEYSLSDWQTGPASGRSSKATVRGRVASQGMGTRPLASMPSSAGTGPPPSTPSCTSSPSWGSRAGACWGACHAGPGAIPTSPLR